MADSMAQLEKRRAEILARHAKELHEIDDKIGTIKLQKVETLQKQAAAFGFSLTPAGSVPKKVRKFGGERRPVTCSLCRKAGLSGEGHTARRHDKWLASQPEGTQDKFA